MDKYFNNKKTTDILEIYGFKLPSFYQEIESEGIKQNIKDSNKIIKSLNITNVADIEKDE